MKRALFLCLLLSLSTPVFAEQITIGIKKTWTVDEAREAAFKNAPTYADMSNYRSVDPDIIENRILINKGGGEVKLPDGVKQISVFGNGGYAVAIYYFRDAEIYKAGYEPPSFYYLNNGALISVSYELKTGNIAKSYKYAYGNYFAPQYRHGQLMRVSISTEADGDYMFHPDGTLSAHWVNEKCYNADGSSCGDRKTFVSKIAP